MMLGGYTAALIGFPAVADPGAMFDTAVARAEEIMIGIVCAGLVSTIVLPRSVAPLITGRLDLWLRDARGWVADVSGVPAARRIRRPGDSNSRPTSWRSTPWRRRCATT